MSSDHQNRERMKPNNVSAQDNDTAFVRQNVRVTSKNAREIFDNMEEPVPLTTSRHRQIGEKRQKPRKPALQMYVPPSKRHQHISKIPHSRISENKEHLSEPLWTDTVDELSFNPPAIKMHVDKTLTTDSLSNLERNQVTNKPPVLCDSSPRKNARREKALYVPRHQRMNESPDLHVSSDKQTFHDNCLISDSAIISYKVCDNDETSPHIASGIPSVKAGGDSYHNDQETSAIEKKNIYYQSGIADHYHSNINPEYQPDNLAQYYDAEHVYLDHAIDINDPISEVNKHASEDIQSLDSIGYTKLSLKFDQTDSGCPPLYECEYVTDPVLYPQEDNIAGQCDLTHDSNTYINECPEVQAVAEYPEDLAAEDSMDTVCIASSSGNQLDYVDSPIYEGDGDNPLDYVDSPIYEGDGVNQLDYVDSPIYKGDGVNQLDYVDSPIYEGDGVNQLDYVDSPIYEGDGVNQLDYVDSPIYKGDGFNVSDSTVMEHASVECRDDLAVDSCLIEPEIGVCRDEEGVDSSLKDPELAVCYEELAVDSCVVDHEQQEVCHIELAPNVCTVVDSELDESENKRHVLYTKTRSLSHSCPDIVQRLHEDVCCPGSKAIVTLQDNSQNSSYHACSSDKEQLEFIQEPLHIPVSLSSHHDELPRNINEELHVSDHGIPPIETMHNSAISTQTNVSLENIDNHVSVDNLVSLSESIIAEGAKHDLFKTTQSNYHPVYDDSVQSTYSEHEKHFECKSSELTVLDNRDTSALSKQPLSTDTVIDTNSQTFQTSNNQSCGNEGASMEVDPDSWESLYDENGDCLDSDIIKELTAAVGDVKVEHVPIKNYYTYMPKELDLDIEDYGHVIEIYDFPTEFLTRDLILAFISFMSRGFDVKWVDDTHALGIFSSSIAAQDALKLHHPMMKVRSLNDADPQSKRKAKRCLEFLQPYKERPQTTAIAARRLVTGALGLAPRVSREKRELEKQQLKQAKEKRRQDRKNRTDAWEGNFGKCAMDEET